MKLKLILIVFIFILSLISVNAQIQSDNVVAAYRFEEGAGTICIDSSQNNLTGTHNGTIDFIDSKGTNATGIFARRFDGDNDFCQVPNPDLNLTIPFSISLWVNKSNAITDEVFLYKNIVGTDTNFGMKLDASEQITIFHRVDGETTRAVITLSALPLDNWTHVVGIVNGTGSTDAFIYFDGVQQVTVAGSSIGVDALDEDFYIGVDANLDGDFLGDLDEVCIFNISLSQTQITDVLNNGCLELDLNTTNLDVFLSKNPLEILESFVLFANYTNATSNLPVLNATCFANSSIVGGGQSGFGRGILGIGGLSTLANAVHTQVNDIFGDNTLRVDIDNVPLGKASYGVNFRFHAHNQSPTDNLRVFATCHNNLTFSNFTLIGQVNTTEAVISTSTGNDTIWGFKNVVLFGTGVATNNCSIVFESQNTTIDKHWMIADTTTTFNLNNSFTSDDFGDTYVLRPNANERSPFVDAGFGLLVPNETTMLFNATSGLYFLDNIRHGRPFDFEDRVFCSADNFQNATDFVVTNVEDNVPPIVQIISIEPSPIIINITNITIQWTANDPELVTNFINVSFPNGTLLIQSELKPLLLTTDDLTVLGNYTVIAFANDTGGLFTLANDTFEVQDLDIQSPVITLIAPLNNTRNNTIPLNITFTVTDDSPNLIICTLTNSTFTFDSGTFTQSVNSDLTLAEGETSLSQSFPNLIIRCFDNTLLNNSAVLNLNYTLDTNPPIIFPISPLNGQVFDKLITDQITIKANATDVPIFRLNLTITNVTGDIIASFESRSPVNNFIVIDELLTITDLARGIYFINHTAADPHTAERISDYNVRKNLTDIGIRYITPDRNEFKIRYLQNSIAMSDFGSSKAESDDRYKFWFTANGSESRRTFIFEIVGTQPVHYMGKSDKYKGWFVTGNQWIDFNFGDADANYVVTKNGRGNWEVEITTTKTDLQFNSVGDLNVASITTTFEIIAVVIPEPTFSLATCPLGSLQQTILFIFFILIAFGIMFMGVNFQSGLIGTIGAILLIVLSAFTYSCIFVFGAILTALGILMISFFMFRGAVKFQ